MTRLATLSIVNIVYGVIVIVVSLLIGVSADAALLATLVFLGGAALVVAGFLVRGASGRGLQTVLAILSIASFPIGTAYAAYAIYVCWINAESCAAFDRRQASRG